MAQRGRGGSGGSGAWNGVPPTQPYSYQYPRQPVYHLGDDTEGAQSKNQYEGQGQGESTALVLPGGAQQERRQENGNQEHGYEDGGVHGGYNGNESTYGVFPYPKYTPEHPSIPIPATPLIPYAHVHGVAAPGTLQEHRDHQYYIPNSGTGQYTDMSRQLQQRPSNLPHPSYEGEAQALDHASPSRDPRRDSGNSGHYKLRLGEQSGRNFHSGPTEPPHMLPAEHHAPRSSSHQQEVSCYALERPLPQPSPLPLSSSLSLSRHRLGTLEPRNGGSQPRVFVESARNTFDQVQSFVDTGNQTGYHLISSRTVLQLGFSERDYRRPRIVNISTLGGVARMLGSISLKWLLQIDLDSRGAEIHHDEDVFEIFDGESFRAYDVIFAADVRAGQLDQRTLMMVVVDKKKQTEGASDILKCCGRRCWIPFVLDTDAILILFFLFC